MVENSHVDSLSSDKAAAKKVLEEIRVEMQDHANHLHSLDTEPVGRMVTMSLEHIAKNGGKIDSSLVGMLSLMSKQDAIALDALIRDKNAGKEVHSSELAHYQSNAHLAFTLANDIIDAGLVELPVVAKGRGRG